MTDDNLGEFLHERVLATRQMHHVTYPIDLDGPAVAVMLDCPEDGIAVVLLPTFVRDLLHLEIHTFVDGERVAPKITPANKEAELVLQRPNISTKLYDSEKGDE